MNVQPKPSQSSASDRMLHVHEGDRPLPRGRVPVAGPRLLYTWPVEFEVEPWRP